MRYAFNDVGLLLNGAIFYFEEGDEEIALHTLEFIVASDFHPTSVVWGGQSLTKHEALERLTIPHALGQGPLGVRLTIENEMKLLVQYLDALDERYPPLFSMTKEIRLNLFPALHS